MLSKYAPKQTKLHHFKNFEISPNPTNSSKNEDYSCTLAMR